MANELNVPIPPLVPGESTTGQALPTSRIDGNVLGLDRPVAAGPGIGVAAGAAWTVSLALGSLPMGVGGVGAYVLGWENGAPVLRDAATLGGGGVSSWNDLTDKPATFPPATHTHLWVDITDKPATFAPSAHTHPWGDITGTPATYAPSAHSHAIGDLPVAPSGTSNTTQVVRADDSRLSNARTPTAHTHPQSDVTNLTTDLAAKAALAGATFTGAVITAASAAGGAGLRLPHGAAPTSPTNGDVWTTTAGLLARINGATVTFSVTGHTHPQSDITNLTTDLAAKANLAGATFTGGIVTATPSTTVGALRIPHGAALSAPVNGDIWTTTAGLHARINGTSVTFSVTGHTHPQSDVTNLTTDLAAKAPLASPALTGTPTAPTAAVGTNTTQIATTAFVRAEIADRFSSGTSAPASPRLGDHFFDTNVGALYTRVTDGVDNFWIETGTTAAVSGGGGGGLADAPSDGTRYGRQNAAWVAVAAASHTHPQSDITNLTTDLAAKAPLASPTFTGKVVTEAGTATNASLNIPHGVAPSAPVNGDIWTTTSGLFARINGVSERASMVGHTHTQSEITGLGTALAAKAPLADPVFQGEVTVVRSRRTRQTVAAAASTTIDRANGEVCVLTLGTNITTLTLAGFTSGYGQNIHLRIAYSGAFTIAWPAAVKWAGGTAPTLTGVSGKSDHIMLFSEDGGTTIYGFVMGQNF